MCKWQIPVVPPILAFGLRKRKSDGTGQCSYLVRYCSQTPRKFACFVLPAWDGRRYLPRSTTGMFVYFYFPFIVARESQCLQWSHLAASLGQAANFEVQLTTTQLAFYTESTCTWELCSGGGDLLTVHPGHSIGPRKLWNAGALTCVIHPYWLVSFTYDELVFNLHLLQDDGEPEAGQSVQGY